MTVRQSNMAGASSCRLVNQGCGASPERKWLALRASAAPGSDRLGGQGCKVGFTGALGPALAFRFRQDPIGIDLAGKAVQEGGAGVGGEVAAVVKAVQPVGSGAGPQAALRGGWVRGSSYLLLWAGASAGWRLREGGPSSAMPA